MLRFDTMTRYVTCLALIIILAAAPARAADSSKTSMPDPASNPALAHFLSKGAKLHYLGSRSGLDGWFLVMDKKMQVVYTTADGQSFLVGALFDQQGQSVTTEQVKVLMTENKELVAALVGQDAAAGAASSSPSAPDSPGEQLMQNLKNAAGVSVGSPTAPALTMIMDPTCSHCQATWASLRDLVKKGTLQVHMVPIGRDAEGERKAAVLLQAQDFAAAWDKYIAGDKGQLAGASTAESLAGVRANQALVDKWGIKQTPYLVYRARDGRVKVLQGEPSSVKSVLADLGL